MINLISQSVCYISTTLHWYTRQCMLRASSLDNDRDMKSQWADKNKTRKKPTTKVVWQHPNPARNNIFFMVHRKSVGSHFAKHKSSNVIKSVEKKHTKQKLKVLKMNMNLVINCSFEESHHARLESILLDFIDLFLRLLIFVMRMKINEIEQRIFIAMSGKNGSTPQWITRRCTRYTRFKKYTSGKNAEKYHQCGRWIFDLVIYECLGSSTQRPTHLVRT